MCISKLPASQQLVGTVTPAFDQPAKCLLVNAAMHFCSAAANNWPSAAWGMGVSCILRDLANLPKPCPITLPHAF